MANYYLNKHVAPHVFVGSWRFSLKLETLPWKFVPRYTRNDWQDLRQVKTYASGVMKIQSCLKRLCKSDTCSNLVILTLDPKVLSVLGRVRLNPIYPRR